MASRKVSILIPANGEKYLQPTIDDLLAHATGEIEIIAVLDGWWPQPPLKDHRRVHIIHWGKTRGMRDAINAAARIATGAYFMKIDAHCSVSQGFDEVLVRDYHETNWIVVPRRSSLDPTIWGPLDNGKSPVDAHFLSYPFEEGRPGAGLHGTVWNDRSRRRKDILLDEEMSSQGSCWFMAREHWDRLGDMEVEKYGTFIQEFQELGLKTWLGGGKVMVNKQCQYLHWHKGKEGRGYFIDKRNMARGSEFTTRYWMLDQWAERKHDLRWLIERFAPVPTWPADLDAAFADARRRLGVAA